MPSYVLEVDPRGITVAPTGQSSGASDNNSHLNDPAFTTLFLAFQMFSLVAASMTLIAACRSSLKRQESWYNFIICIIVFSFSYLLLLFAGQVSSPSVPYGLCLIQSSLTYAATPFIGSCTLGMVAQLYINVQVAMEERSPTRAEKRWVLAILVMPYVLWLSVMLESIAISLSDLRQTYSTIPYCSLQNHIPGRVTTGLFILMIIPFLALTVLIFRAIRRYSTRMSQFRAIFIRICVFLCIAIMATATAVAFFFFVFTNNEDAGPLNVVLALTPVVSILVFGAQPDLLVFWFFWRWRWRWISIWPWCIRSREIIPSSNIPDIKISKIQTVMITTGPLMNVL